MLRLNHILLVPLIVFSLPQAVLFQQQILITAVLVGLGFASMVTRNQKGASLTSVSLLALIIWGKVASDLFSIASPDSALLLLEFMFVIFLMEASNTAVLFDRNYILLQGKNDSVSAESRGRLIEWARKQLFSLGRLTVTAFGLSLGLVVAGDLLSISVNQIAVSGILVLVAVVALLVLLIYGREPEEQKKRRV